MIHIIYFQKTRLEKGVGKMGSWKVLTWKARNEIENNELGTYQARWYLLDLDSLCSSSKFWYEVRIWSFQKNSIKIWHNCEVSNFILNCSIFQFFNFSIFQLDFSISYWAFQLPNFPTRFSKLEIPTPYLTMKPRKNLKNEGLL